MNSEHDYRTFLDGVQPAFDAAVRDKYGEEFGAHSEHGESVMPESDVRESWGKQGAQAFFASRNGCVVGGAIAAPEKGDTPENMELEILYVDVKAHGQGIGSGLWEYVSAQYPSAQKWTLYTPYFEVRNIHFYVNKLGFVITEFFNEKHPMSDGAVETFPSGELFFKFEKDMQTAGQR
ncbi:GNAT family N-acetyltransferase [Alloscardovia venturai]|uniref:GNAT family N-acetyltransferase n=2 Tax=Alloscardovia venturai TaxID=1769421 RepID=A0ABW2Y7K0_9BIFI